MKLPSRPQTRRLFAGIAIAACLTGGLAASGASAQAATIDNPNLSWAKTADLQEPATALVPLSGSSTVDQSQVGAGLPTGIGTAGETSRYASCAPAGAVNTSSIFVGNNGLNNGGFPVPNMGYSAILGVNLSVIPGTLTSGFNVDLMNDPAFKECSIALNLAGPVYVGASSASTGTHDHNFGSFQVSETGSNDGKISVTATPSVPDGTAFGADLYALTKSGTQVRIGLGFETIPNGYWDISLTAPSKVFDATVGQPLTITPSQMLAGAIWQGGFIDTLTPTLSNIPAGSSLIPGGGLAYTPTAAGDIPFSYRLGDGVSTTQLLPATIRVVSAASAAAAPIVTSLDPNHGPTTGGNPVTISGRNLDPAVCTVTFDGVPADVSGGSNMFLNVVAPAHAEGLVDVVVTCNGLTSGPIGYTYDAPVVIPVPVPALPVVSDPAPPAVKPPVAPVPKPAPVTPPATAPKLPVVSG